MLGAFHFVKQTLVGCAINGRGLEIGPVVCLNHLWLYSINCILYYVIYGLVLSLLSVRKCRFYDWDVCHDWASVFFSTTDSQMQPTTNWLPKTVLVQLFTGAHVFAVSGSRLQSRMHTSGACPKNPSTAQVGYWGYPLNFFLFVPFIYVGEFPSWAKKNPIRLVDWHVLWNFFAWKSECCLMFLTPGQFLVHRGNIWTVYSLYITSWIGTAVLHMGLGTRELESFRPPLRCNEYSAVMTSGDSWSLGRCISKFYDVPRFNGQVPRIVFAWVCVCVNVTHGQHPRYFHHVEPNPKSWDLSCRIASM